MNMLNNIVNQFQLQNIFKEITRYIKHYDEFTIDNFYMQVQDKFITIKVIQNQNKNHSNLQLSEQQQQNNDETIIFLPERSRDINTPGSPLIFEILLIKSIDTLDTFGDFFDQDIIYSFGVIKQNTLNLDIINVISNIKKYFSSRLFTSN